MGTALGDPTAYGAHLGRLTSGVLFACIILLPAAGYRFFGWNAVLSFWLACVMTRRLALRPLGEPEGRQPPLGGRGGACPRTGVHEPHSELR